LLLIPLPVLAATLANQAKENRLINNIIESVIADIKNTEIADLTISRSEQQIKVDNTIRSNSPLTYNQVVSLQKALVVDPIQTETLKLLVLPPRCQPPQRHGGQRQAQARPARLPKQPFTSNDNPTFTRTHYFTAAAIPPTPTLQSEFVYRIGGFPPFLQHLPETQRSCHRTVGSLPAPIGSGRKEKS
jgi:hypothetical protein